MTAIEASRAMSKGYWIVMISQAELVAGIVLASARPPPIPGLTVDDIALRTILAYIPTALAGSVLVAEEKGYHFLVGFFLGLFSIPGLIFLSLLPRYVPPIAPEQERNGPDEQ
jgi:hypothetical protein